MASEIRGVDNFDSANVGKVLQVVQGVLDTPLTIASSGLTDIGLSATITPSSTTSQILVTVHMAIGGSGSSYDAATRLLRDSTYIGQPTAASAGSRTAAFLPLNQRGHTIYECSTISNSFLDSPSSTSAIVYKLEVYSNGTTTQYINRTDQDSNTTGDSRHISTITLMEVGV